MSDIFYEYTSAANPDLPKIPVKKDFGFASVILCWKGNEPLPTRIFTLKKPCPEGRRTKSFDDKPTCLTPLNVQKINTKNA